MVSSKPKRDGGFLNLFQFTAYVFFVILGFYLAFLVRFDMNPALENIQPFYDCISYIILSSLVVFYIYDIVSISKESLYENALTVIIALFLIDIFTVAIVFFARGFAFPRSVFILGFIIQFALILFLKMLIIYIVEKNKKEKHILLIVSDDQKTNLINENFLRKKIKNNYIKCIYSSPNNDINKLIDDVEEVYIDSKIPKEEKMELLEYCLLNNKVTYVIPGIFEISLANAEITQVNDILLLKFEQLGLSFEQKIVKRLMDILISLIALVVTLPLMLLISLIIKLYDGGSVFYKQERVTENNKVFELYKFRTMIVDAEKYTGPVLATENDPRITPVGRFLRATRLDELPQFINVLKGDMSVVGPRPERPCFVEKFNDEIEEFKYRTFVKAGITGLAQVLGRYSTDPANKAKFDLLYIKNYSLLLDIKIIFNTLKIIFMKESAAGVKGDENGENLKKDILKDLDICSYAEIAAMKEK
ncbi:sugar transferase [Thermosyntropha sp.]|uniref:sugar transferase n=1 Tax=Thermosyntropha sp. TaxID=2740820 RepID=UPI0025F9D240|nr:sugar transferase [Thermosyntropha sp.]MBO8159711.1 sugar transferase [Thermosyntropha sp.]